MALYSMFTGLNEAETVIRSGTHIRSQMRSLM